ncbi:hypothetical protein C8A05DRAFT_36805 [Staphylotrichum tortipilum]|uniref:Uncharacterized protein n=1 Tax=Staphylotrichum tortipilum TaxID=2831512 RepID=A0AAN6MGM9_9PEZI|nr:hypothetical protein C8A05DRAFT_36805 [Staphylotrichum longicolle]
MAESSSRPLTTLPLLVFVGIAEALCPHCTEDPADRDWKPPIHSGKSRAVLSRTHALASLAATCRGMHYIVLPILYHQVQCYPHQRLHLLRTLDSRPDLARRVKVLRLDFCLDGDKREPTLDNSGTRKLILDDNAGLHPGTCATPWMDWEAGNLHVNLLMAVCPNLEKFSTDMGPLDLFDLLKPGTLQHLKDVLITPTTAEACLQFGVVWLLFYAAPSIERITSHRAARAGRRLLPMTNLRHLHLESNWMSARCLDEVTTEHLMMLLLRNAPQLKHLDLNLNDINTISVGLEDKDNELDWDEDYPDPVPGFASFSSLETLVVVGSDIWAEWADHQPVATLFPQSLRTLTLVGTVDTPTVAGVRLDEFASTTRDSLPNLTSVTTRISRAQAPVEYLPVS